MNLTGSLSVTYGVAETLVFGNVSSPVNDNFTRKLVYTNGTGANQGDLHWETGPTVTLAAGASQTFTLSALLDGLNRTVALRTVRALAILVPSRTAGDHLIVGDPGATLTHAWSAPFGGVATGQLVVYDLAVLGAGADGYAVASGATDQLLIKNAGANPITFSLCLLGASA